MFFKTEEKTDLSVIRKKLQTLVAAIEKTKKSSTNTNAEVLKILNSLLFRTRFLLRVESLGSALNLLLL